MPKLPKMPRFARLAFFAEIADFAKMNEFPDVIEIATIDGNGETVKVGHIADSAAHAKTSILS